MNPRLIIFVIAAAVATASCSLNGRIPSGVTADRDIGLDDPVFRQAYAQIDKAPELPLGYVNLAMLLMKEARKTGDFSLNEKAAAAVRRALEISPNDVPARKLEASLHLPHHRFREAVGAAEKLKNELPGDQFAHGVLTDAYMEIGEYAKAVDSAQRMVDLKPNTASYARVAQLRALHGDHGGAVEMFTQAARITDPADKETQSWSLVQLGDEYWKNGKYAEAEKVYDEALQNFPAYFLALVSKGRLRASLGDFTTAVQLLEQAQQRTQVANAILLLGDIYRSRGEQEMAEAQYESFEAMQIGLGDAADHRRLVLTWADHGKVDRALELARSEYATEKSIHSADILAWALYRNGDAVAAEPYIQEAMRLKTRDAELKFHAGMIARALGKNTEAKKFLSDALDLNPGFNLILAAEARAALEDLTKAG